MNRETSGLLRRGIVVSCQAHPGEPLHGAGMMPYMARAAETGGAVGIRANGEDISRIKNNVSLPVIGLYKQAYDDSEVHITPTLREVAEVVRLGADIVALDATARLRPGGETLAAFLANMRREFPDVRWMADVSTLEEGISAAQSGADFVAVTLSGYTRYTSFVRLPNIRLVRELSEGLTTPVIAEGGVGTPEQAAACFAAGAYAVVVGSAITRPQEITRVFVQACEQWMRQ